MTFAVPTQHNTLCITNIAWHILHNKSCTTYLTWSILSDKFCITKMTHYAKQLLYNKFYIIHPTWHILHYILHEIYMVWLTVLEPQNSHEHNSPFMMAFMIYREHLTCILWTFQQATINNKSFQIVTSLFEKKPPCTCLVMVCAGLLSIQRLSILNWKYVGD